MSNQKMQRFNTLKAQFEKDPKKMTFEELAEYYLMLLDIDIEKY